MDTAYSQLQDGIFNCPTLYFLDDHSPIYVHTDASNIGIGAYITQERDGVEYPVAFLSKSFPAANMNWQINYKEAYAIYYALIKFRYLLDGRKFTIRTDHKNLTFINTDRNIKCLHWKIALQDFDCDVEHWPAYKNNVADTGSRLCLLIACLCALTQEQQEIVNVLFEGELIAGLHDEDILIPDDKYKILEQYHNEIAGHIGLNKLIFKLKRDNHDWPQMRQHARQFIRQCDVCQKASDTKIKMNVPLFTTSTYDPMERLNIDTIGPLTEDEDGYKYILVVIDTFTRWIELYPLRTLEATEAAKVLIQHFGRYGLAVELLSDNGSQFVNHIVHEVLHILGTQHITTLAHSKEENAIVERSNKEVMRHLRAIIDRLKSESKWSTYTPLVQRIFNAQIIDSIGVSPQQILFGDSLHLDRHILGSKTPAVTSFADITEYAQRLLIAQDKIIEYARSTQEKKDDGHMSAQSEQLTEFRVGDYVLVSHPKQNGKVKAPSKLQYSHYGPLRVVSHNGIGQYKLWNLADQKEEEHHMTSIRPFYYDASRTDPQEVANKDERKTSIETIMRHRGDPKKTSTLEFLVKWTDGDETWEPWRHKSFPQASLYNTQPLHDYLRSKKLSHLIPNRFKTAQDKRRR